MVSFSKVLVKAWFTSKTEHNASMRVDGETHAEKHQIASQ